MSDWVFVSYDHRTPGNKEWVAGLVEELRDMGCYVVFDEGGNVQRYLDWPDWMKLNLRKARCILAICTGFYNTMICPDQKDARSPGLQEEMKWMEHQLAQTHERGDWLVPLVPPGGPAEPGPPLNSFRYYRADDRVQWEQFRRHLLQTVACRKDDAERCWVGRNDLRRALAEQVPNGPIVLVGMAGIGKKSLARLYARHYHYRYKQCVELPASSLEELLKAWHREFDSASLLQWPEARVPQQGGPSPPVLVILHDVRDWSLINYLPLDRTVHMIATADTIPEGGPFRRIAVGPLTPEEGAQYLLWRMGHPRTSSLSEIGADERRMALRLAQGLGGLPVVLEQVADQMVKLLLPFNRYLELLEAGQAPLDFGQDAASLQAVLDTWHGHFSRIARALPTTGDLLRCWAFLGPGPVPEGLLLRLLHAFRSELPKPDGLELVRALAPAERASLVERVRSRGLWRMHPAIQATLRRSLDNEQARTYVAHLAEAMRDTWPDVLEVSRSPFEFYLSHVDTVLTYARTLHLPSASTAWLRLWLGSCLLARDHAEAAVPDLEAAVAAFSRDPGNAPADLFRAQYNLAAARRRLGQLASESR